MSCTADIAVRVRTIASLLTRSQQRLATAESCTGGLVAAALTAVAGSSFWFDRGWITYSNDAKIQELSVDARLIAAHGAVSEPVAAAMAAGARLAAKTDYALAVTGIAGPDGGTQDKPVGTICFGWATPTRIRSQCQHFVGNRQEIREQSVAFVLSELIAILMDDGHTF